MINKLKKVTIKDVLGIFKFIIVLIPSTFTKIYLKITKKELWLICETDSTARDNGYAFYKYMIKNHPEVKCLYAISSNCSDYQKVARLGNIIEYSSLKHYFYYMSATRNISSHKQGNPNQTLFTILHLYLNLYNNRVFLQHGVLYQNFEMFHQKNCKFKMFITGAEPEYKFVKEKFHYQNNEIRYTGLARFDDLHNCKVDNNIIFYMPTWRRYLNAENLENSLYLQKLISLFKNEKLHKILEENDKYLYFSPHNGLKKYNDLFSSNNDRIKVLDTNSIDIQYYIRTSSMLITDFSSLQTDFAYMDKPVMYYQYDYKDYMEKHVGDSCYDTYFDFERDGFGEVVKNEDDFVSNLERIIKNKMKNDKIYKDRIDNFFVLHDNKNCERIYEEIMRG